jgi:hypothetical protein
LELASKTPAATDYPENPAKASVTIMGSCTGGAGSGGDGDDDLRVKDQLKAALFKQVPAYMVPSMFVLMDALPAPHSQS